MPCDNGGMLTALVQLTSATDSAANRELIGSRLDALDPAVDLVVLPEASMHDFGSPDHALPGEPLDGPFVSLLADHARRLGATVIAGMFELTDDRPYNTLVALGPDGTLRSSYRKIHLYDSFGYRESDRLSAGAVEPVVVDVDGTPTGLMTCYDLRFPEHGRALVDAGARLFVVPAAWVAGSHKLHHWRTLLTARAVENTVDVVAAAQGGPRYTGHSLAVDGWGSILGEAGADDGDVVVDLRPDQLDDVRAINPSLANRRIRPGS